MLSLGPMPDEVRAVVQRLVAAERQLRPDDERLGYCICGGPGGATYFDSNGSVWNWFCDWDGSGEIVELVPDGPMKVSAVAIAAERVPELAAWLPIRPNSAKECRMCHGTRRIPQAPMTQRPLCNGLGWVE